MKAKGLKRGIVWTLCFTLLPQQGVALAAEQIADFMKPDRDVMVRWLPEEDLILTGEEGVIVLEAGIDPSRDIVTAADVEIRLSQAEAGALKTFRDGDGRLDTSEPLISEEGGVPIWLEFTDAEEDGQEEAILSFTLDEDSPSLRQEFIFQIPVSTTELFDIEVTQEDIQVTPYLLSEEERLEKELLLEKKEKEDKKEKKEKEEKPQKPDPAGENAQESAAEEGAADTESGG